MVDLVKYHVGDLVMYMLWILSGRNIIIIYRELKLVGKFSYHSLNSSELAKMSKVASHFSDISHSNRSHLREILNLFEVG